MTVLSPSSSHQSPGAPEQEILPAVGERHGQEGAVFLLDLFDDGEIVCVFARGVRSGETCGTTSEIQDGIGPNFPSIRRAASGSRGVALRGNLLPRVTQGDVTESQAQALRNIYGNLKSSAKALARDSGSSERSARNHLAGVFAFHLKDFFNACRRNSDIREWGCMMMGCDDEKALLRRLDEIEAVIVEARRSISGDR